MTTPPPIDFQPEIDAELAEIEGHLVVFTDGRGGLGRAAAAIDETIGGALARAVADSSFREKAGTVRRFPFPLGLKARSVVLASLGEAPDAAATRKAGKAIVSALDKGDVTLATAGLGEDDIIARLAFALALRLYDFREYKTVRPEDEDEEGQNGGAADDGTRRVTVLAERPDRLAALSAPLAALAEGVYFTRDLVNEPANRLTTDEFAARLAAMQELGLEVEILGEAELEKLGAQALLAVGRGSASETKLVTLRWPGGAEGEAPLALVGKGVVFDTGGISIKPAAGMEEMTMDMGGAAVVAGVMRTLALRKARVNAVGVVGLVENMPDGRAQRPGDIVKSLKGDTIEVINTDAEGRLVLADALWYAQEHFHPRAVIDLATLTGAMIIALGHHRAGFFSTDDDLARALVEAAEATGDEVWRLPLGKPYARQLKSRLADVKNVGGRPAGSITAAEFLHRFVKDGVPWMHIDIAGVTLSKEGTDLAPKGATGWGVAALDELVRRRFES